MAEGTPLEGCEVLRWTTECVRVVGPMDRSKDVMEYLLHLGFKVIRNGAYTDSKLFPKCDPTRFLYVAEREVKP
jgi:hypothetical protein